MTTGGSKTGDEVLIRKLIDSWLEAVRAKDIIGIMSAYIPDILVFDIAPPLLIRWQMRTGRTMKSGSQA